MAFIPVPGGCARVRLTWDQGGVMGQNVIYFRTDAGSTLDEAGLNKIIDQVAHGYSSPTPEGAFYAISDDCFLTQIEAISLESDTAPGALKTYSNVKGNLTGSPCPPSVAALVRLGTGLRGRSARGRYYQMGVSQLDIQPDGTYNVLDYNLRSEKWRNWLTLINDGAVIAGNLVVCSFFHNKAPRPFGVTYAVTAATLQVDTANQRRRQYSNQ